MGSERAANVMPKETSRARRYEIGAIIRYRVRGEQDWHEGVTENISISGLLIRASRRLEPETAIEMRFFLPVELHGECAAEVFCRGLVVRSSDCAGKAGEVTIAARIVHSRFLRQMGRKAELSGDLFNDNRRLQQ
jgi:PilZ domain